MIEVLAIEKDKAEAEFISQMLKRFYKKVQFETILFKRDLSNLPSYTEAYSNVRLIMLDLDEKRPQPVDYKAIRHLHREFKDAYILAWSNPLQPKPQWELSPGRGSFEYKPIEPKEFLSIIKRMLEKSGTEKRCTNS